MTIRPRDRALLAVVATLAAAAAFYVLVLTPQRHHAAALQRSIASAQTTLAKAKGAYAIGREAQEQLADRLPQLAAAERAVPASSNIPALLRMLERSAASAQVSLQSVSLAGASSGTVASTSQDGAQTVPISLVFGGGYQALNRLVRRFDSTVSVTGGQLSAAGPLVGISSVSLSPAASNSQSSQLTVDLSVAIYQHAAASTVLGATGGS